MKLIHIILGIATLVIIASLINLGIKAFHPEPTAPEYGFNAPKRIAEYEFPCEKGDAKCLEARQQIYDEERAQQEEFDRKNREYQDALKVWNRDFFVAANIVGILVFVAAFFALTKVGAAAQSVAIGTMAAGLWSIIFGYVRGWNSVDDKIKFVVGLAVAALVIGGSVWLMNRYYKKKVQGQ